MPRAASDGLASVWVRLDEMTRVESFHDEEDEEAEGQEAGGGAAGGGTLTKLALDPRADIEWCEASFIECKGNPPELDEDVMIELSVSAHPLAELPLPAEASAASSSSAAAASSAASASAAAAPEGTTVFSERRLSFRFGDLPLCEEPQLRMLRGLYAGERATICATRSHASRLVTALATLLEAQGGCPFDPSGMTAFLSGSGLRLTLQVHSLGAPFPRDGVTGTELLAAARELKTRANALFAAGYHAGAMRKYIRCTWLVQDGEWPDDPFCPMAEAVGLGKGPEPRRHRFDASQEAELRELRLSLHLNLAAGALKVGELHGALAAAEVARSLAPGAAKPLYREAQALLALKDFEGAARSLKALLELEPANREARRLLATTKLEETATARREKASFSGMFARARAEGGALFTSAEIERQQQAEAEKTRYVRDRAEERRRGVEVYDTAALARLPQETQQQQLDAMNAAIEHEERQSQVPANLSAAEYRRLIQMRTDGVAEEKVREELRRMRREEMEKAREHMTREEVERMARKHELVRRDRHKADAVVAQREAELWAEFRAIQRRVAVRVPLYEAEAARRGKLASEVQATLERADATAAERDEAMRRLVEEPFEELRVHLTEAEQRELEGCKAQPDSASSEKTTSLLLRLATERKVEAAIDAALESGSGSSPLSSPAAEGSGAELGATAAAAATAAGAPTARELLLQEQHEQQAALLGELDGRGEVRGDAEGLSGW